MLLFVTLPAFAGEDPCRYSVRHIPRENVAHHGEADLNQNINFLEEPIEIPLEVDFLERFNLALPADIPEMKPAVARLTIYPDGRVEYNGHNVSGALDRACNGGAASGAGQGIENPIISKTSNEDEKGKIIEGQYP